MAERGSAFGVEIDCGGRWEIVASGYLWREGMMFMYGFNQLFRLPLQVTPMICG